MDLLEFTYIFQWKDNESQAYQLILDAETISILEPTPKSIPDWAKLDFNKCPNCLLDPNSTHICPLALHLVEPNQLFSSFNSHHELNLSVHTDQRNIVKKTTAQRAISSLLGLIIPASGCPHTAFFRPMARFHLPLASQDETIFRSAGMYLIAQYYLYKDGQQIDFSLQGLSDIYQQLQTVNQYIARRLRQALTQDSTVNAVILLDIFAKTMPYAIDDSLEDLRHLFNTYLGQRSPVNR